MRINVPSSIRESERTVAERDHILAEAKGEAERIVQQAKQQAMEMLSERALVATAQHEAERIVEESKEIARRRAEEADIYAIQVLQDLSQRLQTFVQQVENGILLMQEGQPPTGPEKKPKPNQKN